MELYFRPRLAESDKQRVPEPKTEQDIRDWCAAQHFGLGMAGYGKEDAEFEEWVESSVQTFRERGAK